MRIFAIALSFLMAVAALAPYMAALQRGHYRPWRAPAVRAVWLSLALVAYNVALLLLWRRFFGDPRWDALYVVAAYLPHVVRFGAQVPAVRMRRTARLVRLWVSAALLLAVPATFAALYDRAFYTWGLWGAVGYLVANVADTIAYPVETLRNRRFVRRASAKLRRSGAIVIGVTGSAGKTTVKRLLLAALGQHAYGTQGNYNTPMGIALSVRDMPADACWFVAEMGVGKPHDMRELLDVVAPDVGVVTCVLPQHTAHFDRVEDIRQEKCLLLSAAGWSIAHVSVGYPADATFGEGGDWWADNVVIRRDGTDLDICHLDDRYRVSLPLCGRQTVDNALAAWAVATHLGVPPHEIAERWHDVKGEPHRLEVNRSSRGVWVIDDSYNCNIRGAAYALEYMRLYEGRKVVATSGIDEADEALGLNQQLGALIASTADLAVVVGDRYLAPLTEGMAGRIPHYHVHSTVESVALYRDLLHEGDVLLILADYPM